MDTRDPVRPNRIWPAEPQSFTGDMVDHLLMWAADEGASDISIQSGEPAWVEIDGVLHQATRRPFIDTEVEWIASRVYRSEAGLAQLAKGTDWDEGYQLKRGRGDIIRFRVNATSIMSEGRDGIDLTFRVIRGNPPTLDQQDVPESFRRFLIPPQGLVLITGETGSGKSTLLAGITRWLLEDHSWTGRILEYAAPIEYTYGRTQRNCAKIAQVQIPRGLPSFAAATRNALRRKPAAAIIQEARDAETISGVTELALTGTLVYSTTHTPGVAATIQRLISGFDPMVRAERAAALASVLRLIVTQRLVPANRSSELGGRIPLREWLVFDDTLRSELLKTDLTEWPRIVGQWLIESGRPMAVSAREAFQSGLISQTQLESIEFGHGTGVLA